VKEQDYTIPTLKRLLACLSFTHSSKQDVKEQDWLDVLGMLVFECDYQSWLRLNYDEHCTILNWRSHVIYWLEVMTSFWKQYFQLYEPQGKYFCSEMAFLAHGVCFVEISAVSQMFLLGKNCYCSKCDNFCHTVGNMFTCFWKKSLILTIWSKIQ